MKLETDTKKAKNNFYKKYTRKKAKYQYFIKTPPDILLQLYYQNEK